MSEWSDAVKGRTQKELRYGGAWKECPGNVDKDRKYSVDEENPRIATMINGGNWCTIIGNTPIPLNTVTSWSIRVLKSEDNDGNNINIGVAPTDIDQNEDRNFERHGCFIFRLPT